MFFSQFPRGKTKYSNSVFVLFSKKYEALPPKIKQERDSLDFKNELKLQLAPKRYKFLSRGDKRGNKLLTQIRIGRSYLNSHSFAIQLSQSPFCSCHFPDESPTHFFLDCFMWTEERRTMMGVFEHFLPSFSTFSKQKKLETILYGYDRDNDDIFKTNVTLQYAVQNFIIKTKRFTQ